MARLTKKKARKKKIKDNNFVKFTEKFTWTIKEVELAEITDCEDRPTLLDSTHEYIEKTYGEIGKNLADLCVAPNKEEGEYESLWKEPFEKEERSVKQEEGIDIVVASTKSLL